MSETTAKHELRDGQEQSRPVVTYGFGANDDVDASHQDRAGLSDGGRSSRSQGDVRKQSVGSIAAGIRGVAWTSVAATREGDLVGGGIVGAPAVLVLQDGISIAAAAACLLTIKDGVVNAIDCDKQISGC